jgi:hypothetical protein
MKTIAALDSGTLASFLLPLDLNLLKKVRNIRRTDRIKLSTQMPPIYFYTRDNNADNLFFLQSSWWKKQTNQKALTITDHCTVQHRPTKK